MHGLDGSSYMAEMWALLHGILAVQASGRVDAMILVDNESVVKIYSIWKSGRSLPHCEGRVIWDEIVRTASTVNIEVVQIPSHGKRPWWEAPKGLNTAFCRYLNEAADEQCTLQLNAHRRRTTHSVQLIAEANRWSQSAIHSQADGVAAFLDLHDV